MLEQTLKKTTEANLILIYYISVAGIRSEDIKQYITTIVDKINTTTIKNVAEIITIPIQGETRIECINPIYILNDELIKKHERLMLELHEFINYEINNVKNDK